MLRLVVVGMCLQTNELAVSFRGKRFVVKMHQPVFRFRIGQVLRIRNSSKQGE